VFGLITVEVSTGGLEFDEVAESLSKDLKQKLVKKLADIAYAAAFWGAPWKTGKLAGSIVKDVSEDEASINALASYAVFVVKGTAPHEIRPVNASVLAFEAGGCMVFTRLVRHPGTKPNPFMQRAVEAAREKVEETFAELWLELIG
jgi:HK97 gp10 family phage protein